MTLLNITQAFSGCLHSISTTRGLPIGLFIAGLAGSLTHCAGMCGPFVIAQGGKLEKLSDALLLPYHLGRMTTYVVLALALSTILNMVFLFLPVRVIIIAPLLLTAGIVFLASAFPRMQALVPWANHLRLPFFPAGAAFPGLHGHGFFKTYTLGVLLGFMPCGLVVSALMAASGAPNAWQAGLSMAAFGLGTIPALAVIAFGGQALRLRFPESMKRAQRGLMTASALWLFAIAGMMLIY